jgi:broad specificity phosphatase PhoE
MGITLLLVRHGETAYNVEGRYQGQCDIPLSEQGRAQADRLARRLRAAWPARSTGKTEPGFRRLPGPPVAAYASDLCRAAETAAILAQTIGQTTGKPLAVRALPSLRERRFGAWEGLTAAEIQARFRGHEPPEGAETWPEVWARMDEALEAIWREHALPPGRNAAGGEKTTSPPVVMVVGHGGSLRAFICRALGVGHEHVRRFRLDNVSLSITELWGPSLARSEGRLALLNDTAHLEAPVDISGHTGP